MNTLQAICFEKNVSPAKVAGSVMIGVILVSIPIFWDFSSFILYLTIYNVLT